ncbi:MAG: HAMP domain-containing sensor histidine kinase [Candidatus Nitrosotalea sp.]|nr:HAMP domain-containing sensor histidine kinase [Candidatus Nitrosotalea sp.]
MDNHKTSTSLRIGISIAMIIIMLGLAIFLNIFTTYTITNQMKVLSDLNIPITQGISRIYTIQQMQYQSFDNTMPYQKIANSENYKFSKNQFESYNNQFDYQVKKINELTNSFLNYGLDDDTNKDLSSIITNLNEIQSIHTQYVQKATQIFQSQGKNNVKDLSMMQTGLEINQNQINLKISMLDDDVQKLTNTLETKADESKQKSVTLQAVIIISAGIISLALGYFLNLINKDLVQEVIRKTKSLQKANRKLERTNILKDDFINIASHELKSPLHPIYGFVELAQNGDMAMGEALEGISKQARQLEEVANRILDIGRIDNGILQLSYEKFNLSDLLSEIVSSYRTNEKIQIKTNFEKGIEVEADRVRMGQVIRNLINNALKFTEEGGIHVIILHDLEKNSVEVTVSDSGSGIHPDILPNLFNKFATRGPKTESWKGNGLGLYLCRGIINAHGGHIIAYNNKESGATIKFTIPIMRHLNAKELHQKIMN